MAFKMTGGIKMMCMCCLFLWVCACVCALCICVDTMVIMIAQVNKTWFWMYNKYNLQPHICIYTHFEHNVVVKVYENVIRIVNGSRTILHVRIFYLLLSNSLLFSFSFSFFVSQKSPNRFYRRFFSFQDKSEKNFAVHI